jgi:transcriptional regulator with XRE-family HTH domain
MTRLEVARALEADYGTLIWWEQDERQPFVHFYPAIVRFLGHEPWQQPVTLGDHLMAERRRRGLRIDQAAVLIGVDQGTLRRWERGEWKPTKRTTPVLDAFLDVSCREAFPGEVR